MVRETFQTFIDELLRQRFEGKQNRLAQAIGLTPSAFGRQVRAGSLGLESLLRLSKVAGLETRPLLELAGKGAEADLLESIYGAAPTPLSDIDRELLNMSGDQKKAALALVGHNARARAPMEPRTVKRRRTG